MKEIYRDQFGEFVCGYWGLKGYYITFRGLHDHACLKLDLHICF